MTGAFDLTTVLVKFTHRVDLNLDGFITSNDASIFNGAYKVPAGSSTSIELPFNNLTGPGGVAVDTAGNVYVTDQDGVLKLPVA